MLAELEAKLQQHVQNLSTDLATKYNIGKFAFSVKGNLKEFFSIVNIY